MLRRIGRGLLFGVGFVVLAVTAARPAPVETTSRKAFTTYTPVELEGVHHVYQIAPDFYTGGEPGGEAGFAALAKLGVRTVIRVDSAQSDLESARKHGMKYVHIPVGYDGIEKEAAAALLKALRQEQGPFYLHCHHGEHRGPAMAAVALKLSYSCNAQAAKSLMTLMGTSPDYEGLWKAVDELTPDSVAGLDPPLHEVAPVGNTAEAMTQIDHIADRLKACAAGQWTTPSDHPDIVPAREAQSLHELFSALLRDDQAHQEDYLKRLRDSAEDAKSLQSALTTQDAASADIHWTALKRRCQECHKAYRNTH